MRKTFQGNILVHLREDVVRAMVRFAVLAGLSGRPEVLENYCQASLAVRLTWPSCLQSIRCARSTFSSEVGRPMEA